jgi:hypothetical protein
MSKHKAKIAGLVAGRGNGSGPRGGDGGAVGPAANLGGYAVAQVIAGSVGLGGPALSTAIAAVGGPVVAGAAVAAGRRLRRLPRGEVDLRMKEHTNMRRTNWRSTQKTRCSRCPKSTVVAESRPASAPRSAASWARCSAARSAQRSVRVSAARSASLSARSPAREARDEQPRALVGGRSDGEKLALGIAGGLAVVATGGALAYAIAAEGLVVASGGTLIVVGKAATTMLRGRG